MNTGILVLFLTVLSSSESAKILGIVPSTSYSHQVFFQPLWRELSLRGHQVTTLTTDPIKDPKLTNLTEIDLHFSYDAWNKILLEAIESTQESEFKPIKVMLNSMNEISEMQLEHPEVQLLLHDQDVKFDLVILEYFTPVMFTFAEKFKCPYIGMISLDALSNFLQLIGNPSHPVLYTSYILPFVDDLTLIQRIKSVVSSLVMDMYINNYYSLQQKQVEKYFGTDYLPLRKAAENVSMLFINSDPIFHKPKAFLPNVIQIGGGSHRVPAKPLPKELQTVLNQAENGAIYFSLGSNVKSKDISINTRNAILTAFAELPYTILWKFEAEDLPNRSKNVIISKWFPQQDILKHPNIKLFITQGGLQSMDEAIYDYVPMVGIPVFGDQFHNVQRMVNRGCGLSLDYRNLDKDTIKSTILEVINNPKYKNRIKELADLATDQPMTGLEKAVWWSEYVIRHKGAKHFRSPLLDIPSYQYYLLDVIGILLLIVAVSMYILYILFKLFFRLIKNIFYSTRGSKIKTN